MAKNLNNMCLYKGKSLDDKIRCIEQAIKINSVRNEYWALAENYNNLGRQYYFWDNYNKAIEAFNIARNYASSVNAKELIQDNNRYFADLYDKMGQFKLAFNYTKLVLDEVESEKMADRIRVYQSKILQKTIDKKDKNIIEQKQQFQITLMKYVIAIILLLLISLVCAAAYVYNNMKHKATIVKADSANRELNNTKEQLTNTAVLVRSRGEMLNNIQTQIKDTFKLTDTERLERLHKLSRSISTFNSKDNEMEIMVDKISGDFIEKLSAKYPDLTQNEKRLASLLKIGLSSKEISIIISSQPKSVDMARYRLRKKLNLETDEVLQDALSKI